MLTISILGLFSTSFSQEKELGTGFGGGIQVGQYQKDFGIGAHLTSPFILNNKLGFRLRGNMMYNEHVINNETTWGPYFNSSLGLIVASKSVGGFMRLYAESGSIVLFPSQDFSSKSTEFGGYGLFDFEFFMSSHNNFFLEIGGVGTGAKADKIPRNPIYSNGLIINAGFRMSM